MHRQIGLFIIGRCPYPDLKVQTSLAPSSFLQVWVCGLQHHPPECCLILRFYRILKFWIRFYYNHIYTIQLSLCFWVGVYKLLYFQDIYYRAIWSIRVLPKIVVWSFIPPYRIRILQIHRWFGTQSIFCGVQRL